MLENLNFVCSILAAIVTMFYIWWELTTPFQKQKVYSDFFEWLLIILILKVGFPVLVMLFQLLKITSSK
jgi:hypothetical protein